MQQQNATRGARPAPMHDSPGSAGVLARFFGLCALLLLAGCSRPDFYAKAIPSKTGETLVRVENPGTTRVQLERGAQAGAWDAFSMRNAGDGPLRKVQFWDMGRHSLVVTPTGVKAGDVYTPFTMMPGEELALTAPSSPNAPADQLFGILHWISPRDPQQLAGALTRIQRARGIENGSIILTPAEGNEAYVQMELSAPLSYESVRIAWEAEPEPFEPQLWFNLDGDVWARQPLAHRVDWLHPADITQAIAGRRRFWLRLVYEVPKEGSSESGTSAAPPESLIIRRIRIDRQLQGPGELKKWKTGRNDFDVRLEGKDPNLEIRVNGKKPLAPPPATQTAPTPEAPAKPTPPAEIPKP